MSDHQDMPTGADGDDILAGEYALGVLQTDERKAVEQRMAAEPGFADKVAMWEQRLAPLAEWIQEIAPSPAVWRRISANLSTNDGGRRRERPARNGRDLWNSLPLWRGLTAASLVAAAACLAVIVTPQPAAPPPVTATPRPPSGPLTSVAMLKPEQDNLVVFVVMLDRQTERMVIAPIKTPDAPDHTPQLWLMEPGAEPVSLGLLDTSRALTLPAKGMTEAEALGAALAVSMEPRGGSPTGLPTGPVIAQGRLSPL